MYIIVIITAPAPVTLVKTSTYYLPSSRHVPLPWFVLYSVFSSHFFHLTFQMTGLFQFCCRLASETEARFTSVERLSHYVVNLEHEGPFENDKKLPIEWPSTGKIDFVDVEVCNSRNS